MGRFVSIWSHRQPIRLNDYANPVALTNDPLSTRVESNGDARNAVIECDGRYSLHSAETGAIHDGVAMSVESRRAYLVQLYEGINDPLVQAAFHHEMVNEECAKYDFQGNIPKNEFRATLQKVANERIWLTQFMDAWAARSIWWEFEKAPGIMETIYLEVGRDNSVSDIYKGLTTWATKTGSTLAISQCRNAQQLGLRFRDPIKKGRIIKRKSHGAMMYSLARRPLFFNVV